jgi:Domain of unknown function (DUF1707)
MAEADRGDQVEPAVELRASHEDRDRVAEILRIAAGDGRLTAEELDERLEVALTARTQRELTALTTDLPATADSAAGLSAATPKDLVRIETHSGTARRNGPWVVPQAMEVRVTSGSVLLDFTEAVIATPVLKINTEVKSGTLRLITKPGIVVDTDDVSVRSGTSKVRAPWGPGAPVTLRVEVSGSVGSGSLNAGPRRRTFWQWLLRRPQSYASIGR